MVLMLLPKLLRNWIQLEHHVTNIIVVWFILNLTKKAMVAKFAQTTLGTLEVLSRG